MRVCFRRADCLRSRVMRRILLLPLIVFPMCSEAADPPNVNYDESKIAPYTLPDPFTCLDGTKVTDAKTWREKRRPELLELFQKEMHGRSPAKPNAPKFEITSSEANALGGIATRKEIAISFSDDKDAPKIHALIYVPN